MHKHRGRGEEENTSLWTVTVKLYRQSHDGRGRRGLRLTDGTFVTLFLLLEMMILKGDQQWLMNHSSSQRTCHWNTVIRYLPSESFSVHPLIPVTLASAVFLLSRKALLLPLYHLIPCWPLFSLPVEFFFSFWLYSLNFFSFSGLSFLFPSSLSYFILTLYLSQFISTFYIFFFHFLFTFFFLTLPLWFS